MNKKKIELQVLSITCSQEQAGAYALLLGETKGNRQLPIIIGASEAQAIMLEVKGIEAPRPLTHVLFSSVLQALGVSMMRAVIYKVTNGIYYSYIYLKSANAILRVDSRTSDAVALALRMAAPVFAYEDVFMSECIKEEDFENDDTTSLQNGDLDSLNAAMKKAIETENYEYAAQLRDAINQHAKKD